MKSGDKKYTIIGVDEVGRGPLAGPVAVGAVYTTVSAPVFFALKQFLDPKLQLVTKVKLNRDEQLKMLKDIKDSKKLTEKKRNEWFEKIKNNFEYSVSMIEPQKIDKMGIVKATQLAVARSINNLLRNKLGDTVPDMILLDGLLKAPVRYNQVSIIRGDEKVPLISAASVMAKVTRDNKMKELHKIYPEYSFDRHKGYGTKVHFEAIEKHGITEIHRKSFLKSIMQNANLKNQNVI